MKNLLVAQSGGPSAAINATLVGVVEKGLSDKNIDKVYGAKNGIMGLMRDQLIELNDNLADPEVLQLLCQTPSSVLGSCRMKLSNFEENTFEYEKIIQVFRKHNIGYFIYIGGNDSMDTVAKVSAYAEAHDYEIRVMGVPKTIDNDLVVTDHTPGFGSAAKYIATSMAEMLRDCAVYTVKAVTIVEIMGRDAGWLTASAALTRVNGMEPDLVYLPERPFDLEQFFEDVKAALDRHPNVVIAVSEGIRTADGTYVCELVSNAGTDAFGHKMLSGTGKALELAVKERIGCKVRSVEINILQRCAAHLGSLTDITESVSVGKAAVEAASSGLTGKMMTIERVSTDPYVSRPGCEDIEKIANMVKGVPAEFINERGNGITDEGVKYLLPLIAGESYPVYENGLPVFLSLK